MSFGFQVALFIYNAMVDGSGRNDGATITTSIVNVWCPCKIRSVMKHTACGQALLVIRVKKSCLKKQVDRLYSSYSNPMIEGAFHQMMLGECSEQMR